MSVVWCNWMYHVIGHDEKCPGISLKRWNFCKILHPAPPTPPKAFYSVMNIISCRLWWYSSLTIFIHTERCVRHVNAIRSYLVCARDPGTLCGGQGGHLSPPMILKSSDFLCFYTQNFCFFHILPPPRKSVKILPPMEKTEMTSLTGTS